MQDADVKSAGYADPNTRVLAGAMILSGVITKYGYEGILSPSGKIKSDRLQRIQEMVRELVTSLG